MDEKKFTKEHMSFYEELRSKKAPLELQDRMVSIATSYSAKIKPLKLSYVVGIAASFLLLAAFNFWVIQQSQTQVRGAEEARILMPTQSLYNE